MFDIICRIQGMWLMFDPEYNVFGCNYTVFVLKSRGYIVAVI